MRLSVGLINSEVSWNQPEELTEQMRLSESHKFRGEFGSAGAADRGGRSGWYSDDWGNTNIPTMCPGGGRNCVADAATTEEQSQLMMTVEKGGIGADFEICPSRNERRK
jgi:hypothetical protein